MDAMEMIALFILKPKLNKAPELLRKNQNILNANGVLMDQNRKL